MGSGRIYVEPHDHSRWRIVPTYFSTALREAAWEVPGMSFIYSPIKCHVGYPDAVEVTLKLLKERGIKVNSERFDPDSLLARVASETEPQIPVARAGRRSYQNLGVNFLISQGEFGALLADGMRLGKTMQSLTAARALRQKTLVVCPSHVVGVWARSNPAAKRPCEVERWWPEAHRPPPFTPEGTKPDLEKLRQWIAEGGQIVVIHYDILYAWVDVLISIFDFKILIIDECHAFMDAASRRSKAGLKLTEHAKTRYFLSGTPMLNRPRDLFSVGNLLSPGRFGDSFFRFCKRYANAHEKTVGKGEGQKTVWDFDGSSNEDELKRRLSFFMLRRTKAEVAEQLPKETRQVIELTVPRKFSLPNLPSLQSPAAARKALELAADGALPQVVKMLEEDHIEGTKQVVFTFRRSVAEFLYQELQERKIPSELIHGLVPTRKREARIQAARDAETSHTLVATIDSCSTGIDLSYASTATYVELPWEIVDLLQSKERLYNFQSLEPIFIRFLCVKGTAQEIHLEILIRKLALQEAIVGKIGDDKLKLDLQGYQSGEDSLKQLCQEMMAEAERRGGKEKGKKGKK